MDFFGTGHISALSGPCQHSQQLYNSLVGAVHMGLAGCACLAGLLPEAIGSACKLAFLR